jgi:metallo-beta-lactamase class B
MRLFITISSFLICLSSISAQQENKKLVITHLTGDFYIYTTYQDLAGKPYPANSMYLVTNAGVVLFDTPWDTTQFQPLLDSIQIRHHKKAVICIATHFHEDRTAGLEFYKNKGLKTYTTLQTDELSKKRGMKRAEFLLYKDSLFTVGQYTFQTYFAGAGHSPDNIVIWFEKEKILYGGCLIKSTEAGDLGNLSDANVIAWGPTLRNIQSKCKNPVYIIPGHLDWSNKESLNHTLNMVDFYLKK